jgi:hypothetical protein
VVFLSRSVLDFADASLLCDRNRWKVRLAVKVVAVLEISRIYVLLSLNHRGFQRDSI